MLHLRLLGEPLLTDPSLKPLSLWRPEMALVALVACSGRQVRREAAAALLWPESPEGRARGALRQTLFRLRQRAGEVVWVRGEGLALDSARVSVDVLEMERSLEKGHPARWVELYEGPFLEGFFLTGNAEFDRWADARRARFREDLEKALHALLLRAEEAGEWRPALEWAERLADLSPFAVDGVFRLARLRALSGDRDGALRALEELGARLRDELEVKPPPEVAALAERIRAGAGPKLETPRSPGRREASPEPWPMLGRAEEPAGPRAADGRPFPAPERAARSLLLLALLAEGADREAIGEALSELEATDPTDHPTWADDREITALARARAREALGDARASLEALRTAREQVDDAFGLGLLLLEEARLLTHLEPQSARGSHLRAQEILSPLGLRVEPGRQGSSPTHTGGAGDRSRT